MEEDGSQQSEPLRPRCAGSAVHGPGRDQSANSGGSGFFTSAHWSADGTSVVTASEDHSLRTYVLYETKPELWSALSSANTGTR